MRNRRYFSLILLSDRLILVDIAVEEMLHMTLVGNTLISVGGTPKLYHSEYFPVYKMQMVNRKPDLEFHLLPFGQEMINIAKQVSRLGCLV